MGILQQGPSQTSTLLVHFAPAGNRLCPCFAHLRFPPAVVVAVIVLPRGPVLSGGGILHQRAPVVQEEHSLLAQARGRRRDLSVGGEVSKHAIVARTTIRDRVWGCGVPEKSR